VRKYKHIYFDLDRTIWDFEGNSYQTIRDLVEKFNLNPIDPDDFHRVYTHFNEQHWAMFREGKINKEKLRLERFVKTLEEFKIYDNQLAEKIALEYIKIGPTKTGLMPHAKEILDELSGKYSLYVITNGFIEIQTDKLRNSGISSYFKRVFTSEHARSGKPNRGIFEYALTAVNARKKESLMIGDDLELDIIGAKTFGIDQVYYNPLQLKHSVHATYEIMSLLELKQILL
jgi:putative hydrolase of the HAD superfamily